MPSQARHEMLVGLHVTDDATYARYREAMTPLLEAAGGSFRYDFTVAEMLKGDASPPINRVFVLSFPSSEAKEAFFADPEYLAAKQRFFEASVDLVELIATYDHAASAD